MKTLLLFLAVALSAISASAVDLITATITVTNNPAGLSSNITVSGSTRYFTNDISGNPGTLIMVTNTTANATTNLLNNLTAYPAGAGHFLTNTTPTNVVIRGRVGEVLAVSVAGNWASVVFSTQMVSSPTFIVRVPIAEETATNQTNIASLLVNALQNSSNALGTNWTVGSNYLTRGASPKQIVIAPIFFFNIQGTNGGLTNGWIVNAVLQAVSNISGTISTLTNGYWTNGILDSPFATNLIAVKSFRAPGTGVNSEQQGFLANAAGLQSVAEGYSAAATGPFDVAIGSLAQAAGGNSLAAAPAANAYATNGSALSPLSTVNVGHDNSTAVGYGSSTSASNQVRVGRSFDWVSTPGNLSVEGSISNLHAAGTNVWRGDINWPRLDLNSLGDGNNISVPAGTNVFIRCNSLASPATICGIIGGASSGGRDGQPLFWFNDTGFNLTFAVNTVDPVPANRINTPTSTDLVLQNQGWLSMLYDGTDSRWKITGTFPTTITATNLSLASGSLATNTASFTITTNDFVINSYYTNVAQRSHVSASLTLGATITDAAQVSLFVDQDADGTWERTGFTAKVGGAIAVTDIVQLGAWLQPGARFLWTNQSAGAATASITANSSQWIKQ